MTMLLVVLSILVLIGSARPVSADNVIVTRAMQAETILELSINTDEVVAEFEVGRGDFPAFEHLFPTSIRDSLNTQDTPNGVPAELDRVRSTDWNFATFLKFGNQFGTPTKSEFTVGRRVQRDIVTGAVTGTQPDDAEPVVRVRLMFRLDNQPAHITLIPPAASDGRMVSVIGFVARHLGVAINDFRYLTDHERLFLDWADPWFSVFGNSNLSRQFSAPFSGFLNIEYFEVRKEQVLRLRDLAEVLNLTLDHPLAISVDEQQRLKKQIGDRLLERCPVKIDGQRIDAKLDRIHFVEQTLRSTTIIDSPRELNFNTAMLGVIIVYPIDGLPDEVQLNWDLFTERTRQVPVTTTDDSGSASVMLTDTDAGLAWTNQLESPTLPPIATLPEPNRAQIGISAAWVLGGVWIMIGLVLLIRRQRHAAGLCCFVGLLAGTIGSQYSAVAFELDEPTGQLNPPNHEVAHEILSGLLSNSYHAFDRREEELVFDRLARSISGELLREVYLKMRKGIELEMQGGARVRVLDVELDSVIGDHIEPAMEFEYGCRWTVAGTVGHWGHQHSRINQYDAMITIAVVDGRWKMTGLELLDSQRTDKPEL